VENKRCSDFGPNLLICNLDPSLTEAFGSGGFKLVRPAVLFGLCIWTFWKFTPPYVVRFRRTPFRDSLFYRIALVISRPTTGRMTFFSSYTCATWEDNMGNTATLELLHLLCRAAAANGQWRRSWLDWMEDSKR